MQFFKYELTEKEIIIAGITINRQKFEEWVMEWNPFDFPESSQEEIMRYWQEKTDRDPVDDLTDYIKIYHSKNDFDRIFAGIKIITDGFSMV